MLSKSFWWVAGSKDFLIENFVRFVDVDAPIVMSKHLFREVVTFNWWCRQATAIPIEGIHKFLARFPIVKLSGVYSSVSEYLTPTDLPLDAALIVWARFMVMRIWDCYVVTLNMIFSIVSSTPHIYIWLSTSWGFVSLLANRCCTSGIIHNKTICWVPCETALALSGLDILDESSVNGLMWTFKHDTPSSWSVALFYCSVSQDGIGRTISTDRVFRPRDIDIVYTGECIYRDVVAVSELQALSSRERPSRILHVHFGQLCTSAIAQWDASWAILYVYVANFELFGVVHFDVCAV